MTTPALNPLVLNLRESATLAINLKSRERRNKGQEIYHFGFGQSPFPVPDAIQEALRQNADKKDYLPTRGLPELCESVANFYNWKFGYNFSEHNVCIGPGSKELIFQMIYLLEGPLLVPAPSWVSYGPQASLRGKDIVPITTKRENGYRLQVDELDQACYRLGQTQKLLILNNPNNPTGCVYKDEEVRDLAEICRAYQVIVISDEIYAMIDFTEKSHRSIAHYYPEGTIISGGLSKSFAAGGYRLGVMLIPDSLDLMIHSLKSVISETFSAVSAPIQYAALVAYDRFEEVNSFIDKTCEIHRFVGEYLCDRFLKMGLNCPKPEGSFYLFPDFENYREKLRKRGIITCNRLCDVLLKQAYVAVLPASDFYLPASNLGVRVASVDYDGEIVLKEWTSAQDMNEKKISEFFPNLKKGCDSLERFLENI